MQLIGHVKPQFTLPIQQIFLQTLIETLGHIQTHLNSKNPIGRNPIERERKRTHRDPWCGSCKLRSYQQQYLHKSLKTQTKQTKPNIRLIIESRVSSSKEKRQERERDKAMEGHDCNICIPQAQRETAFHFLISKHLGFLEEEEDGPALIELSARVMFTSTSREAMAALFNWKGSSSLLLSSLGK